MGARSASYTGYLGRDQREGQDHFNLQTLSEILMPSKFLLISHYSLNVFELPLKKKNKKKMEGGNISNTEN